MANPYDGYDWADAFSSSLEYFSLSDSVQSVFDNANPNLQELLDALFVWAYDLGYDEGFVWGDETQRIRNEAIPS